MPCRRASRRAKSGVVLDEAAQRVAGLAGLPDGVDADGALEVSGLLPFTAAAVRQPGLKLNPPGTRRSEPQLKSPKSKVRETAKRSSKGKNTRSR